MTEMMQSLLLAPVKYYELYKAARMTVLILIILCAAVSIVCILMQNGNSNGIDAISGSSETFYSKNKGRSKESVLKIITVVCLCAIAVLSIGFYLLELLA